MAITTTRSAGAAAAALAAMVALAGAALPARAQSTLIPGVTGCSADGGKQAGGAVMGALAGGLLGNSLSGHHRTEGTLVGGALGAAAGSAVGCQMQKNEAQTAAAQNEAAQAPADAGGDYPLARGVATADYDEGGDRLVATKSVSLRASPDRHARAVGQLRRGERFDAMAQVRGTNWILVGRDGMGVGYVQQTFTHPDRDQRYAGRN